MNNISMNEDMFLNEMQNIPIFKRMETEDLLAISKFSTIFSYDKNEAIIEEGTMNNGFCVLTSGKVEIVKKTASSEVRLAVLKSPSIFGETSLFKNELTTATVRTLDSVVVLVISRDQFSGFINSHPKAGNILLTYIALGLLQKLKSTNDELVEEKNLEFSSDDIKVLQSIFNSPDNL